MSNIFAPTASENEQENYQVNNQVNVKQIAIPDYSVSPSGFFDHVVAAGIGFAVGFGVLWIFYQIFILAVVGGALFGIINIFISAQSAIKKRKLKLRVQFFDMLESMSVSMRAGNPPIKALENAREDLSLLYQPSSDIMIELNIILARFNNAVPLSEIFEDFAERSGLEDIGSFAQIYATIEGKSARIDEIVRETQQIISDKMEIEMEIDTMMTAAKSEVNIMLFMPLVILGVIGYAGAGFMDALYTTTAGRIISTIGLVVFIGCVIMARKFSNIKL